MKKNKRFLLVLVLIYMLTVFLTPLTYASKIPSPNNNFYIYDEINLLSKESKDYIIETNELLYNRTGAQIVVVIIEDLEGEDINYFATKLFEKWEIGSKDDNGVLILIDYNNKNIWIEIGYGLEGILPDTRVRYIIEEDMVPYFLEEEYEIGLVKGYNKILFYVGEEYNIGTEKEEIVEENNTVSLFSIIIGILIVLLVFLDIIFFNGSIIRIVLYSLQFSARSNSYPNNRSSKDNKGGGGRSGGGGSGSTW